MILELKNLCKAFGRVVVADGVELSIPEGEALGMIGPNGAGKSSLFNLIAGGLKPNEGDVFLDGNPITAWPPWARCVAGIGRSHQVPRPFENLTVFENVTVGAVFGQKKPEAHTVEICADILNRTGLMPKANKLAGSLSLLERKRLEMARALATQPRLLLLDEIAGGLTERECQALIATIRNVRESGITIVWIEHVVHALLAVVDRLVVLNSGKLIVQGEPRAVMASREVRQIYLGMEN